MHIRFAMVACIAAAGAMATPTVATAAYPGSNGRIVFEQDGFIYSIKHDGSDRQQLTTDTRSRGPRWSPDGRSIAFHRSGDIWIMKANGSAARQVTSGPAKDFSPSWSPDGRRLVFSRTTDGTSAGRTLYVVSSTGGSGHRLTSASDGCALEPTWSATGRYVVYWDECASGSTDPYLTDALRKVDTRTGAISDVVGAAGLAQPDGQVFFAGTGPDVTPDGSHVVFRGAEANSNTGIAITDLSGGGLRFLVGPEDNVVERADPAVSPDGTRVVYTTGNENPQLDVVSIDGGGSRFLYESNSNDFPTRPDWQPRP